MLYDIFWQAMVPAIGYYSEPSIRSSLETEVLFGEVVRNIDDAHEDFLLIQSEYYKKPGYVLRKCFRNGARLPTHRVVAPSANFYLEPSFKSPHLGSLSMNALVEIIGGKATPEGVMVHFAHIGWIFADQVRKVNDYSKDYVQVARSCVGKSSGYTWGKRTSPDCSALVMDVLLACGIKCPRNVSEQVKELGTLVDFSSNFSNLKKGDLVFWTEAKGSHVVIMVNGKNCVHATIAIPHRCTVEQPLAQVIADQERDGNGRPTHVRRFEGYRFE